MNIEEFREYCISLPDVTEATPFENFSRGRYTILVFYVGGHMFCYFNIDDFRFVTIKCDPEQMAELKERYQAVGEPFNGDSRYWISVEVNNDVSDEMLRELVRKSYELVKYRKLHKT
ncbi:MAG: MmcQ/YjbR family DNA-binding protein [Muribaculaceae bacterium]|nr:MmcQ/YjbR family DNA-binding protein [Muribaculaceae bacterium]